MRKTLLLGLGSALALLLSGCGAILSMIGGTGESFIHGTQVTLQGKLLNWPGGTGTIYNVHSIPPDSSKTNPMQGTVQDDGSFTLPLTYPPSWNLYEYIDDCNGSVQVSDPSVGITYLAAQVNDSQGNILGSAQERNTAGTDPVVGKKWIKYIFAEGDVSFRGTCNQGTAAVTADVNLQTGWNAVITEITEVQTSEGTTYASKVKMYVAESDNGFHWYFDAWPK